MLIERIEGMFHSDIFQDTAVYQLALNLQTMMYFDVTMQLVAVYQKHNNTIFKSATHFNRSINGEQFNEYFKELYPHHTVIMYFNSFTLSMWVDSEDSCCCHYQTIGEMAYLNTKRLDAKVAHEWKHDKVEGHPE